MKRLAPLILAATAIGCGPSYSEALQVYDAEQRDMDRLIEQHAADVERITARELPIDEHIAATEKLWSEYEPRFARQRERIKRAVEDLNAAERREKRPLTAAAPESPPDSPPAGSPASE